MIKTLIFSIITIIFGSTIFFTAVKAENWMDFDKGEDIVMGSSKYLHTDTTISEDSISNDLIYAGKALIVNGDVGDNVIFAGYALEINGNVEGDILFAGAVLVVNGKINGDIRAFGNSIFVNSEEVGGDVTIIAKKVKIAHETLVGGEKLLKFDEAPKTKNPANLSLIVDEDYPQFNYDMQDFQKSLNSIKISFEFISLIGIVLMGYFLLKIFPTFSEKTISTIETQPLKSLFVGLFGLVSSVFIAVLLAISLVGIQLLGLLSILAAFALMSSTVYTRYAIGRAILVSVGKNKTGRFIPLVLGVFVVEIPLLLFSYFTGYYILGIVVSCILNMTGIGSMIIFKLSAINIKSNLNNIGNEL